MSTRLKPDAADQRRYKRIQLSLPVKFLGDDFVEHEGMLLDVSAGGLAVATKARPLLGATLVVYVNDLGRVEGRVVRYVDQGIAVEFAASDAKRERLTDRLTWIANRDRVAIDPKASTPGAANQQPRFILGDGREIECRVLDMSMHGVRLQVTVKPPIGEEVTIGRMRGRISQHHATGIAIEFLACA